MILDYDLDFVPKRMKALEIVQFLMVHLYEIGEFELLRLSPYLHRNWTQRDYYSIVFKLKEKVSIHEIHEKIRKVIMSRYDIEGIFDLTEGMNDFYELMISVDLNEEFSVFDIRYESKTDIIIEREELEKNEKES